MPTWTPGGGGRGGGGGGDELPASNEDGDPNPTNSDPTGPTNTAVAPRGGGGGGTIVRVNPQWSGCLTPLGGCGDYVCLVCNNIGLCGVKSVCRMLSS